MMTYRFISKPCAEKCVLYTQHPNPDTYPETPQKHPALRRVWQATILGENHLIFGHHGSYFPCYNDPEPASLVHLGEIAQSC